MMILTCNSCFDRDEHRLHLDINKVLCNKCGCEINISDFAKRSLATTPQAIKIKNAAPATPAKAAPIAAPTKPTATPKTGKGSGPPKVLRASEMKDDAINRAPPLDTISASVHREYPSRAEAEARSKKLIKNMEDKLDSIKMEPAKPPKPPPDIAKYFNDEN